MTIPDDMKDIELLGIDFHGHNCTITLQRGNLRLPFGEPAEFGAAILNREEALKEKHAEEIERLNLAGWAEIDKLITALHTQGELCTKWRERAQAAEAKLAAGQATGGYSSFRNVHPDTIIPMWNKAGTEVIHVRYADIISGNHP
jgi:hypothetical protein